MIRLIILIYFVCSSYCIPDPACDTKRELNDWKRSVKYVHKTSAGDIQISDTSLVEGWYRITSKAGEKMPTDCPRRGYKCCTTNSVWLSDENVKKGESLFPEQVHTVVERVACASDHFGNCCKRKYNIKIKNCGGFFSYYLVPVSVQNTAYCFGDKLPCPNGTNSETGFPPNCGTFPKFVINPKPKVKTGINILQGFDKKAGADAITETVQFECQATGLDPKYTCIVRWYINNNLIKGATTKGVQANKLNQALLLQSHWDKDYKPNMNVKCSLQLMEAGFQAPGFEQFSDEFMAGFEITQKEFLVMEGKNVSVPVKLTIPVGCKYYKDDEPDVIETFRKSTCVINLLVSVPEYQRNPSICKSGVLSDNGLNFEGQMCGIKFSSYDWQNTQYVQYVHISAASDSIVNMEDRTGAIRLYHDINHAYTDVPVIDFFKGVMLDDIQVRIRDKDIESLGRSCSSNNDPHMTTFDGATYGFHQKEGEYILYKHTELPVEVHGYYRKCNIARDALCNCGAAVRSGDSIFVANYCIVDGHRNNYAAQRQCGKNELKVEEKGNTYKVKTLAGSVITIKLGTVPLSAKTETKKLIKNFFGINSFTIEPSPVDFKKTEGLCGYLNGAPEDDFYSSDRTDYRKQWGNDRLEALALSWRVNVLSDSLFNIYDIKPAVFPGQQYCTCIKNATEFPFGEPNVHCKKDTNMDICSDAKIQKSVFQASCRSTQYRTRRRRSVETGEDVHSIIHEDDNAPEMYLMDVTKGKNSTIDLNWKNGWTEKKARSFCETSFQKSAAFTVCSDHVPSVPSEKFVKECIEDIRALDTVTWKSKKVTIRKKKYCNLTPEGRTNGKPCYGRGPVLMEFAGDTSWMQISVNNFGSACLSEASKIENLTRPSNSSDNHKEATNVFEMIAAASCPQNCSGQGVCNDGLCQCMEGYVGISCDRLESEAPIIFSDSFDGHCDVSNRPCKLYVIPGLHFADVNLTCKYRHYEIYLNETVFTGLTEYSDGEYSSMFSVKCPAPHSRHKRSINVDQSAMGYFISVSNDGKNFTEELAIIIFDSKCFECNTTDLSCEPVSTCPQSTKVPTKTHVGAIVGAALGGAAAVIAAVTILLVLRNKMIKRRTKVKDSTASLPNETLVQRVQQTS